MGLSCVKTWLPDGKMEGDEWVCHNPNLGAKNLGSFKVNLSTGCWADFSDDARGRDVVSLYAYIYEDQLSTAANNYPTYDSGLQVEAAKAILFEHDPCFMMPEPQPQKKKGSSYWEGFRPVSRGVDNPPDIKEPAEYLQKNFGTLKRYFGGFTDKKGRVLLWVVRYFDEEENKKNDRPFTLWTNGKEFRWRAKGFDGLMPLYNLPKLTDPKRANQKICFYEGQKNAEDADKVIGDEWVCSSLYGWPDKSDLEPLRGREVWYWFDPDSAGRKKLKKFQTACKAIDCIVHPVRSPAGKAPGWDVSDAIEEGWDKKRIIDHQEGKTEVKEEKTIEEGFPFDIVGLDGDAIVFFPHDSKRISRCRMSALTKGFLFTLMPREDWGLYFQSDKGGIAWDAAIDFVVQKAKSAPIFESELVRGSGCWIDRGRVVAHTGEYLIIDGERHNLESRDTEYIYERGRAMPYETGKTCDSSVLLEITKKLRFKNKIDYLLLSGWLLLAPFAGALSWRPHAWISGPRGAGKTWILQNIVYKVAIGFALKALGSSTPPGIRQALRNMSKAVVIDEAESDNKKQQEYVEEYLTMARQSSSGGEDTAGIYHGSTNGEGVQWVIRSMFLFASIGANIKYGADADRTTKLNLKGLKRGIKDEGFPELRKIAEKLTPEWAVGFHSRTLGIFHEVIKAIDIIVPIAAEMKGTRRDGDQLGTLLAGAYMVDHDRAPTEKEALEWLGSMDLSGEGESKTDEEMVLDEILSAPMDVWNDSVMKGTIGYFICAWYHLKGVTGIQPKDFDIQGCIASHKDIYKALTEKGIKPVSTERGGNYINVAAEGHVGMRGVFRDSAWKDNYPDMLMRLDGAGDKLEGPGAFGSLRKRFVRIDIMSVFYNDSEEVPF